MTLGYVTQVKDYWIAPTAISITLNALGEANRVQGSVASGAVIMCYIEGVIELGYDNGHEYRRWPLSLSPTYFNNDDPKYVYCAIPRTTSIGSQAVIVFPSVQLDIDGKNESEEQIGSTDYLYIYLHGIISAPFVDTDGVTKRKWTLDPIENWGQLDTAAARDAQKNTTDWYNYDQTTQLVTFLKGIVMSATSWFQNIRLGNKNLTGVATVTTSDEYVESDELVVTPSYLHSKYLSKISEDEAQEQIGFLKGLWIKTKGLFGFDQDGNVTANDVEAVGALKVDGDGSVGGDMAVGGDVTISGTTTANHIQSDNFSGEWDDAFGAGFQLKKASDGSTSMTVDNLFVRLKAIFTELEIRKMSYLGGNIIFSHAGSRIVRVEACYGSGFGIEFVGNRLIISDTEHYGTGITAPTTVYDGTTLVNTFEGDTLTLFRCYLLADDGTTKTENWWRVGDLARCQTFNLNPDATTDKQQYSDVSNTYYWRRVVATGSQVLEDGHTYDYVDLSATAYDTSTTNDEPKAGDQIVQMGNDTDTTRQGFVSIEVSGEYAPSFKMYKGVNSFSLEGKRKIIISPTLTEVRAQKIALDADGSEEDLYNEHYKGEAVFLRTSLKFNPPTGPDQYVLSNYGGYHLYVSVAAVSGTGYNWTAQDVSIGDIYELITDGHLYMWNGSKWEDKGLKDESKSSLKVYADQIAAEVSDKVSTSTFVQRTDSIESSVTALKQGKNLLSGVLTGKGWFDEEGNEAIADSYGVISTGEDEIYSPVVASNDEKLVFSVYILDFTSYLGSNCVSLWNENQEVYPATHGGYTGETAQVGNYTYKRYYWTIRPQHVDFSIHISPTNPPSIIYPQLEVGNVPTKFDGNTEEISSRISQNADSIELAVTNKLGQTGIVISGSQRRIELRGDKVTFQNTAGTLTVPKIRIEPTTGALIASQVDVSGKITATSGTIGGFSIGGHSIKSTNSKIVLNDNGSATIGGLVVENNGSATLTGTIVATKGSITGRVDVTGDLYVGEENKPQIIISHNDAGAFINGTDPSGGGFRLSFSTNDWSEPTLTLGDSRFGATQGQIRDGANNFLSTIDYKATTNRTLLELYHYRYLSESDTSELSILTFETKSNKVFIRGTELDSQISAWPSYLTPSNAVYDGNLPVGTIFVVPTLSNVTEKYDYAQVYVKLKSR